MELPFVGCQPLAVQETKVQAPTFQFITSDYNPGGVFEVQEPTGEWRVAHLHFHKAQTHIVLHFPATDEYEGLNGGYTFTNGAMRDSDGDMIQHRLPLCGPTQPAVGPPMHQAPSPQHN